MRKRPLKNMIDYIYTYIHMCVCVGVLLEVDLICFRTNKVIQLSYLQELWIKLISASFNNVSHIFKGESSFFFEEQFYSYFIL